MERLLGWMVEPSSRMNSRSLRTDQNSPEILPEKSLGDALSQYTPFKGFVDEILESEGMECHLLKILFADITRASGLS